MEGHLGASNPGAMEKDSLLDEEGLKVLASKIAAKPTFLALPEGQGTKDISAREACNLLGKKLRFLHEWVDAQIAADAPFQPFIDRKHEPSDPAALLIRVDPYEQASRRFIFIDDGNVSAPNVLIREPTGELRHADRIETLREGKWLQDTRASDPVLLKRDLPTTCKRRRPFVSLKKVQLRKGRTSSKVKDFDK